MPLLSKCCRLISISEHYVRFGPEVCELLQCWVRHSPKADVRTLCDTLQTLILCARESPDTPHRPYGRAPVSRKEAAEGLCKAACVIIDSLVDLSEGDCRGDCSQYICSIFRKKSMIVVSAQAASFTSGVRCRLLSISDAYWSVAPELCQDACAAWALQATYGTRPAVEQFFVNILGVRAVLTQDRIQEMQYDRDQMVQRTNGHGSTQGGDIVEGLTFHAEPDRSAVSAEAAFDPLKAVNLALHRARGLGEHREAGAAPKVSCRSKKHRRPVAASVGEPPIGPALAAAEPVPASPCLWHHIGDLGGFPLFGTSGADPPFFSCPDVDLLHHLCRSFGLPPSRLAFAYDPSGRCVCENELFLDASRISRASQLAPAEASIFWTMELAHAIAHQGVGHKKNSRLVMVVSELVTFFLPRIMEK